MSKKMKLIPDLRFPDFKNSKQWNEASLNKLANRALLKNRDSLITTVFTNSAIDGIVDQREYFDKDIANKNNLENYYVVEPGDYVYNPRISNVAPVGPLFKNKTNKTGVMSPLYTVFRFNEKDNEFYEYYFKSRHWHDSIRKVANTGARFDRISITDSTFMEIPVLFPEPKEQQKIASCLSSLDKLIAAHSDKLEALKDHKKGLTKIIFPQKGQKVPNYRFPEFEKDGAWVEKEIGKIADNLDSRRIPITRNKREKGNIPYYGASGIIDYVKEYIFDEDLLLISEDGANLIARVYPIAFSISGKTWVNNHAHVLKFENWFTQVLVEKYLNSKNIEDFLTGMAQPKLNRQKLDLIPIHLPKSEEEQQKIASCLSSLDELITAQLEKIEQLQQHKKGLMQGLFPNTK